MFDLVDRLLKRFAPLTDVALVGADEPSSQRAAFPTDKLGAVAAAAAGNPEEILGQHALLLVARW